MDTYPIPAISDKVLPIPAARENISINIHNKKQY